MRDVYFGVGGLDGCCGITEIHGFPEFYKNSYDLWGEDRVDPDPLTDEEWIKGLRRADQAETYRAFGKVGIVIFTQSTSNVGPCTPKKLARWLRSKGEVVRKGPTSRNPKTGNDITPYLWTPSKKFVNNLYKDNKKKESDASRGTLAA